MKQLLLILNPKAGLKKAAKKLPDIISVFNRADFDVHTYITTQSGDAIDAVAKLGKKMDLIVCCGGDGTFNETITGIIRAKLDVPLGYIPAGSTNDFANSLNLNQNIVKSAEQIVAGSIHEYDVGKFGSRYFSYVASFGMFTKSSYATPQELKNTLGHMAYLLGGITELSKIRREKLRIELPNEVLEDEYIFGAICNSTSVGGVLTLDPNVVDMADGVFELLLIRAPRNITELNECILSLLNRTYECKMITFRTASTLKISASPQMMWTLDGEMANGSDEIKVENLHNRIKLIH
ncbi:MAG: YegS/Rv2252/BmrU family lipid kinase [Clostridia bacterium]|nr:YegS/Rv2252/BmrU family lipid kinase [Clostridia bacterium]